MEALLKFNLPAEAQEFEEAQMGHKAVTALWNIREYMYNLVDEDETLSDEQREILNRVLAKFQVETEDLLVVR